jgi:arylsulfatase A-like enzyme
LLHLECFDPHEPFFAPKKYRALYPTDYDGPILNWPRYQRVEENADEVAEVRANYAALVSMCDAYFGKILDYFDQNDMWKDTALIVTTDHGYMLAEHDWWAKSRMPFYDEISHIPLLIYHPDYTGHGGARRHSLTQTVDIMPTLLDIHGSAVPSTVQGFSLLPLLEGEQAIRPVAVYGRFAAATNVTDGRYTYFRYPEDMENQELWEYTLMPTHQRAMFGKEEFEGASLVNSFAFLRGFPVLKLPAGRATKKGQGAKIEDSDTVLYDLKSDPKQMTPIDNPEVETRLIREMLTIMAHNEAPPEAYTRLGLEAP